MALSTDQIFKLNRMNKCAAEVQLGTVLAAAESVIASEIALADAKILVGNASGVGAAVDISGDATIARTGALTIANDAITLAKMYDIAQGSIIVGGTSDAPTALDSKTDGYILVGDGTDLNSVAVSGDVTLANTGAITIAAGAVEETMLVVPTTDALNAKRIARATFDYSTMGTVGAHGSGVTLPDNAIIQRAFIDIDSGMTSAGGAGTIAIHAEGANDILSAVDADTLSGISEGIQDGTCANMVKCTAARELTFTVAVEDLTAGHFTLFVEYVVGA